MQEQTAISLPSYILILIGIIIFSGVLGGVANFHIVETSKKPIDRKSVWGYVVLGVVAAFTVPLFLNMISSNLLEIGHSNFLALFVFCGFCLVAAVFSKSFLENMYSKVIREVKEVKEEVQELKEQESEPEMPTSSNAESKQEDSGLSEHERRVLFALGTGKYSYRSLSGIMHETGLSKEIVKASLDSLVSQALVAQTYGIDEQKLWFLTSSGKKLLGFGNLQISAS